MRWIAGVVGLAVTVCIMHVSGCGDPVSHPYSGRFFIEARGCLGSPSVVDVVTGAPPGSCPATCLVAYRAEGDAGRAAYVGITCPPFPSDYDSSGKDPICAAALAAAARDDQCLSDGGSTHPVPPAIPDAGVD